MRFQQTSLEKFPHSIRRFRAAVIFLLCLSLALPFGKAQATDGLPPNPFYECDCVYLGYDAAPEPIQRLIQWTFGGRFDNLPEPPAGWANWSAMYWPGNIEYYGPQMDSSLDWDSAVDQTPEVGALVVWSGDSTVTWLEGGYTHLYTHGPAGHIAVVTAYDLSTDTISVQEKNWAVCNPPERQYIDISSSMTFIHYPQPFPTEPPVNETAQLESTPTPDLSTPVPSPTPENLYAQPGQSKHERDAEMR